MWAKKNGISYRTAWRWAKSGNMPVPYEKTRTGTYLVSDQKPVPENVVALYARVSGSAQKGDLDRQLSRLVTHANTQGWMVSKSISEIGSGLNGHRPKLMKLLADQTIKTIVVEHRDRLMRFGVEYVESSLKAQGRNLIVIDKAELKNDLVQDMIEVLTSFCARMYGQRSAKQKAKKALEVLGSC